MRRADIISDIESLTNVSSDYRQLLARAIHQEGLIRYSTKYPWPHYRDTAYITTIAPYETGTVTVTNGSKTVTGDSTTFTVLMVGRKIKISTDTAFYEIAAFVSTTELTLKAPYQGTSASALTYSIFKDEYRLAANAYKLLNSRQLEDGTVMVGLSYADFDELDPDLSAEGDPIWMTVSGRRADTYETGTVAITSGSKTITGTSTAWLSVDGLTRGSRIAIVDTSEVFTVKDVASDTSLTVYESPVNTEASSAYIAILDNIVVQVGAVPDAARNLYYRFHRLPAPMISDYDEPDMPKEHHHFLYWAGASMINNLLGKQTVADSQEAKFLRLIDEQWMQLSKAFPKLAQVKESMDFPRHTRLDLRWPATIGTPLG